MIDSDKYEYLDEVFTDSYGNTYDGAHNFGFYWSGEGYAVFNLNREYNKLSGNIVTSTNTGNAIFKASIYCDDSLVFNQEGIAKTSGKIHFDIDVSGVTKLEFRFDQTDGSRFNSYVDLVDVGLTK